MRRYRLKNVILQVLLTISVHQSALCFRPSLGRYDSCRPRSTNATGASRQQNNPNRLRALRMATRDKSVEEFGAHQRDPLWQQRSKYWIILVDDEEAIRAAVGQLLYDRGYQVTTCPDGLTALQVARSQDKDDQLPDVVVSDVRMPGMDGLQLLKEIRTDEKLVTIPVVLLTAKGMTQDRIAGYDAGADAYVPKPFDADELVSIVDNVIERRNDLSEVKVGVDDLKRDLDEIKYLLLEKGGGGVGNGFVEATNVFLAPDERELLELLCEGLMNKEIAQKMFLSTRRVEALLTGLFRKANVKNRTELVRWAIATGNVQI